MNDEVYTDIKAQTPNALSINAELHSNLSSPEASAKLLVKANSELVKLSALRGIVQTCHGNLGVQVRHMQSKSLGEGFKNLADTYTQRTLNACDTIKILQTDLGVAHDTLSECSLLVRAALAMADAELDKGREKRAHRVERWIASIGVGVGSAELISENVGIQLIDNLIFGVETFTTSASDGNFEVFAVRSLLVCGLSLAVFFLYPKAAKRLGTNK